MGSGKKQTTKPSEKRNSPGSGEGHAARVSNNELQVVRARPRDSQTLNPPCLNV